MNVHNLLNQKFGKWLVLEKVKKSGPSFWLCECQCAQKTRRNVGQNNLVQGKTKSCGCARVAAMKQLAKHGMRNTAIYSVWLMMRDRCRNPRCKAYPNYGGRGIRVCDIWNSFQQFFSDMGASYASGLCLERVDNDRNYSPENCVWATRKVQSRNTRQNHFLETSVGRMVLTDAAAHFGISVSTIRRRIARGVPHERLFDKGRVYSWK